MRDPKVPTGGCPKEVGRTARRERVPDRTARHLPAEGLPFPEGERQVGRLRGRNRVGRGSVRQLTRGVRPRRHWVVILDTHLCTVDDLRLGHAGWNFDDCRTFPRIGRGDIAVVFDRRARSFRCVGRFVDEVRRGPSIKDHGHRYDFHVHLTRHRDSPPGLAAVRHRLALGGHPLRGPKWLGRVFTPLARPQFNDLIAAWWGVTNFASDLDRTPARWVHRCREKAARPWSAIGHRS